MDLDALLVIPPWEWPPEADRMLRDALRDEQAEPSRRLLAAQLAGDIPAMSDDLAETLITIVRADDEDEVLRGTSAISLGPILEYLELEELDDLEDDMVSERTARRIQASFREVYLDPEVPKEVRRRVLEAAVRAPQEWQEGAARAAFRTGDDDWELTAVFCMRFLPGFQDEIAEALESDEPAIYREAILAAGSWEVDAAWPHIRALVRAGDIDRPLLLAAIDAATTIRPEEAGELLGPLLESLDDEIADAALEAVSMAEWLLEGDLEDTDLDGFDDWGDDLEDEPPPMGPHGNGGSGKRPWED